MATYQVLCDSAGRPLKSTGRKLYGRNVTLTVTTFSNGAASRMPYAVSRDLQPAAIAGKELYFRVKHNDLRSVGNGGLVQTGFDLQFETTGGAIVPWIQQSYDPVTGTLFGVFNNVLAGASAATRGYLYFNNPSWTTSRQDATNTLVNCFDCLFLPSGINHSDTGLDFSGNLPTSDKVIVNPGALLNGTTDYIWRALGNPINSFLISIYAQDLDANSDNALWAFGLEGGNTVIFIRRLFGTAAQHTGGETNSWRFGFVTTETGVAGNVASFYETRTGSSGTNLQHVVIRRFTDGTDPQIYLNGVLEPIVFKYTDLPSNAAQKGPIVTTSQRLMIGRGSTATRFWHGYLDCFKFFSGSNKSSTWAASEYANLIDIDGSVIFGDPETVTTATMFGETVDITCDGFANVTFPADKYVINDTPFASVPSSPPSIQSLTQPSGGSLAVVSGNQVKYTNVSNTDPDNDGAVKFTNGAGTVLVPVRAKINVQMVVASGYYKVPNSYASKLANAVVVTDRNSLLSTVAAFNSNPNWYKTKAIKITGDITGGVVTINTGGDATDPLIITMAGAGTDSSWNSRPKIKAGLKTTKPYLWFYGCQFDWPRILSATIDDIQVQLQSDWQFATACKFIGNGGIGNYAKDAVIGNVHINFNRFDVANTDAIMAQTGSPYCVALYFQITGFGATAKVCHPLTVGRNYWIDDPTHEGASVDAFHIGEGKDDGGHYYSDIIAEYNYLKADVKRGFYIKAGIDMLHNDIGPVTTPGGNIYGQADCVIGFRGPFAKGGLCAYNRLRGGEQLMVHGPGHRIVSNVLMDTGNNGNGGTRIHASAYLEGTGKPTPSAEGCLFIGNTGGLWLPWYIGNADNATKALGYTDAPILIAGHNGTITEQATLHNDGPAIPFSASTGHPTGTHPWLKNSSVTKQTAIPTGYHIETPPFLDTVVTGPGATGKVWGT